MKYNIKQKNNILIYATKHTIKEAATHFKIAARTISKWKAEAKAKDKDKDKDNIQKIISLKQQHPEMSAQKIKDTLNLTCTVQAIYKTLKSSGLNQSAQSTTLPLTTFMTNIKKITGTELYLYTLHDQTTQLDFAAYSDIKDKLNVATFLNRVLDLFQKHKIDTNKITIYTPATVMYQFKEKSILTYDINFISPLPKSSSTITHLKTGKHINKIFPKEEDRLSCNILLHNIERLKKIKKEQYHPLVQDAIPDSLEQQDSTRLNKMLDEMESYGIQAENKYDHQTAYDTYCRMLDIINLNDTQLTKKKIFTLIRCGMSAHQFLDDKTTKRLYKEAYELAKEKGDPYTLANAEYFYGHILFKNSKFKKALKLYINALATFQQLEEKRKICIVSGLISALLMRTQELNKGFGFAILSYRTAVKLKNEDRICAGLIDVAKILKDKEYYRLAEKIYHLVIKKANKISNLRHQATAYNNLSIIHKKHERYSSSKKYSEKARLFNIEIKSQLKIIPNIIAQGLQKEQEENYASALIFFSQALSMYIKMKNYLNIARGYKNIGRIYHKQNRPILASKYYKKALKLVTSHDLESLRQPLLEAMQELKRNIKARISN